MILLFFGPWAVGGLYYFKSHAIEAYFEPVNEIRGWAIDQVTESVRTRQFPREIQRTTEGGEQEKLVIEYTLDSELQSEAEKQFKIYKPDFGAIVVMNADNGKIMALASYERNPELNENLAVRATFPAASIFKMVTAAAAVDRRNTSPGDSIRFNGGNHTLYRRNVMNDDVNRWTQSVTLREAFARSLNSAFGRLAFERLKPRDLEDYAVRFGFNREIQGDIKFDAGFTEIPTEKSYQLAEIASGFNRITKMSPLQGALMASAIANNGLMPKPILIDRIFNESGETVLLAEPKADYQVLTPEGAERMKVLMEETVRVGTSRQAFRKVRRDRRFKDLEIGGKTGSLTGLSPKGRTDWFVGYAINEQGEKLAISAVTVHVEKWRVKSAQLAQYLVKKRFRQNINLFAGRPRATTSSVKTPRKRAPKKQASTARSPKQKKAQLASVRQ